MYHVQMFGVIAKQIKTELIFTGDKQPSLIKTVAKIQECIYSFFKANNKLVWRGCAMSLADMFDNCFPEPL